MWKISGTPIEVQPTGSLPGLYVFDESQARAALQSYLDALPIAAGQLEIGAGGVVRWIACNRLLEKVRDRADAAGELEPLIARLSARPHCQAGGESAAWQESGLGGRHFEIHLRPIAPSPISARPRVMVTLLDRTTAMETERSLRLGMIHDSLTGLPNRVAFDEAIDALLDAGQETGFAVLAIDLVRFSRINEGIGSLAGDELIVTVASRLKSILSAQAMLARMAADEFCVLVPLIDGPGDALHVARRVQDALALPLRLSELEIKIDCAIGCAMWHDQVQGSAEVIRNAQFALKRAKRSGRIEVYQPGEAGRAHRRFSLETELRRAIEGDRLELAFQPLVELETRRVAGFEALARWNDPERGPISPTEFIAVAEESGLIVPLGRWVVDRALRTLAEWDRIAGRELPVYLGINVSPVQLARDPVPQIVASALARHAIDGRRLTLELTESSIIADPDRAGGILDALKALSCRIAMDDFGTGYSSLASLQRLPIDVLKIDRQFVSAMFDDRDSTAIIRAVLSLASALGMTTIAEGVETGTAAHMLTALGCTIGQGYFFARPMPADEAFVHLNA